MRIRFRSCRRTPKRPARNGSRFQGCFYRRPHRSDHVELGENADSFALRHVRSSEVIENIEALFANSYFFLTTLARRHRRAWIRESATISPISLNEGRLAAEDNHRRVIDQPFSRLSGVLYRYRVWWALSSSEITSMTSSASNSGKP
jgi:hypothetical protein